MMLDALDRLDTRFAGGLIPRPELLLVVVGVLFALAAGVHYSRVGDPPAPVADHPEAADDQVVVGPAPEDPRAVLPEAAVRIGPGHGETLDEYTVTRARILADRAAEHPDEPATAIVSFDRYLHPEEAEEVLGGVGVGVEVMAVRWQLRADATAAPAPTPRGRITAGEDLREALAPVWESEASQLVAEAADLDEMAATTDDEEFSSLFTEDAEQLRTAAEAAAGGRCACLYAAEVRGPLHDLAVLLGADEVRLVDVAPPGAGADEVVFVALLPEERAQGDGGA